MKTMTHTYREMSFSSFLIIGASLLRKTKQMKCLTISILTRMVLSRMKTLSFQSETKSTLEKDYTSDKTSITTSSNLYALIRVVGVIAKAVWHTALLI